MKAWLTAGCDELLDVLDVLLLLLILLHLDNLTGAKHTGFCNNGETHRVLQQQPQDDLSVTAPLVTQWLSE